MEGGELQVRPGHMHCRVCQTCTCGMRGYRAQPTGMHVLAWSGLELLRAAPPPPHTHTHWEIPHQAVQTRAHCAHVPQDLPSSDLKAASTTCSALTCRGAWHCRCRSPGRTRSPHGTWPLPHRSCARRGRCRRPAPGPALRPGRSLGGNPCWGPGKAHPTWSRCLCAARGAAVRQATVRGAAVRVRCAWSVGELSAHASLPCVLQQPMHSRRAVMGQGLHAAAWWHAADSSSFMCQQPACQPRADVGC